MKKFFQVFYVALILLFIYAPIFTLVVYSFVDVPVVGTVLEFIVTALAYAIGGIILAIRIVFAFVLYFLIETASFVEEIIRAISETVLALIS